MTGGTGRPKFDGPPGSTIVWRSMEGGERVRAFRVIGRVQGVGFRWWTRRRAEALGVRGTVRNCPDGSVEVVAAGPAAALASLESALAEGPPGARVQEVRDGHAGNTPLPAGFEIIL